MMKNEMCRTIEDNKPQSGDFIRAGAAHRAFAATARVGDIAELPVCICETDRVACDPVVRMVNLKCRMGINSFGKKHVIVYCPALPQGLRPGVYIGGGTPMLRASDMRPRSTRRA